MMRSELFITMWGAKGLGPDMMIRFKRYRKHFSEEGYGLTVVGFKRFRVFTSSYQGSKQPHPMQTVVTPTITSRRHPLVSVDREYIDVNIKR